MKVLIAESGRSDDFYSSQLDGPTIYQLLKLLGLSPVLRYTLDREHLRRAIAVATSHKFQVFHLSCHGGHDGIQSCDGEDINWGELAAYFQDGEYCPGALVMSACCGASSSLAGAFASHDKHPNIIFGTIETRDYDQFAVAWAILYRRFMLGGVRRSVAQRALREICAVVHESFLYRRWDDDSRRYLVYPPAGRRFAVSERMPRDRRTSG